MATIEDFNKLDIRVGKVIDVKVNEKARKPAYVLKVDFGSDIGIKTSSAQITTLYKEKDLLNRQVLGVVNFPPRKIADITSEVLILGTYSKEGVVLIKPDREVSIGDKLG